MTKVNDQTPFWGSKTQPELKYLQSVLNNKLSSVSLTRASFRKFLKLLVDSVVNYNGEQGRNKMYDSMTALASELQISVFHVTKIYASLAKLFELSMRQSSIRQEIIRKDLREILNLPTDYANDFASALYSHLRKDLDYALINIYRPSQVTLSALSWRIDVCISTSALSRNLLPVIVIQTNLSDGKRVSFEMSLNSFNILRFNVALVLKEIEDVLNRQTFKILAD